MDIIWSVCALRKLRYFLLFSWSWATQKMCIVFHFSSISIHAVCVNVPLRPEGQKWTWSVLPWRGKFWWWGRVSRDPFKSQGTGTHSPLSCWDAKEVAYVAKKLQFFQSRTFPKRISQYTTAAPSWSCWGQGCGFQRPVTRFSFPTKQQQLGTAVPKTTGFAWPKISRGTNTTGWELPGSANPREMTLQGEGWAKGGFSAIFVPQATRSSLEAAILGWVFSTILFSLSLRSPPDSVPLYLVIITVT